MTSAPGTYGGLLKFGKLLPCKDQKSYLPTCRFQRIPIVQSHICQCRTSGRALFLLACIHPVMSCRAGWIFHPSTSSGSFGSSKQAAPCMQARVTCAQSFCLGIDDFALCHAVLQECQGHQQYIFQNLVQMVIEMKYPTLPEPFNYST